MASCDIASHVHGIGIGTAQCSASAPHHTSMNNHCTVSVRCGCHTVTRYTSNRSQSKPCRKIHAIDSQRIPPIGSNSSVGRASCTRIFLVIAYRAFFSSPSTPKQRFGLSSSCALRHRASHPSLARFDRTNPILTRAAIRSCYPPLELVD